MLAMEKVLNSSQYINQDSVQFWYSDFHSQCCGNDPEDFCLDLLDFEGKLTCSDELGFKRRILLLIQEYQFYIPDFRFNVSLDEIDDIYELYETGNFEITAARAKFQHKRMENTTTRIKAMNQIRSGMSQIHFDTDEFLNTPIPYAYIYTQWEANETISAELVRNLGLTFATIAIVSLILIMNVQVCILVLLCVIFTVIDVCGFAHFMGLTIEMVTSISLILSVGLALDYAAHFAVVFTCLKSGNRQEKMTKSLE